LRPQKILSEISFGRTCVRLGAPLDIANECDGEKLLALVPRVAMHSYSSLEHKALEAAGTGEKAAA